MGTLNDKCFQVLVVPTDDAIHADLYNVLDGLQHTHYSQQYDFSLHSGNSFSWINATIKDSDGHIVENDQLKIGAYAEGYWSCILADF